MRRGKSRRQAAVLVAGLVRQHRRRPETILCYLTSLHPPSAIRDAQLLTSRLNCRVRSSGQFHDFGNRQRPCQFLFCFGPGFPRFRRSRSTTLVSFAELLSGSPQEGLVSLDVDPPIGVAWDRGFVADFPEFTVSQLRQGGLS
ncbi:MAG: hypothetical protein ACI8P0_006710, partial [Planctomycetaceae bacterium]